MPVSAKERPHGTMGRAKYGPAGRDHHNACHCRECRNARRRSALRRELHGPAYVDATPARQHVTGLLAAGMTRHQVALLAGVDRTQIRHLMVGQNGRPPARGLRPETAAALLTVQPDASQPAEGATCDATGTRRRLQALMANGWPAQVLAARLLGLDNDTGRSAILQVARRERVRSSTALAVRALYVELADRTGPSQWCRTYYRGRGWLPPLFWDDDTIDDTTYVPPLAEQPREPDDVDPVIVDRLVDGLPFPGRATRAEKVEAYRRLVARGAFYRDVQRLLRVNSVVMGEFAAAGDAASIEAA